MVLKHNKDDVIIYSRNKVLENANYIVIQLIYIIILKIKIIL